METILVTEGLNEYGGYILKAKGRVFTTLIEILAAFPDSQVDFIQATPEQRLKMSHQERALLVPRPSLARNTDFNIFEE